MTDNQFSVGDTVRVNLVGGATKPPVARYLFAITQRGLRYAAVGTSATFRTTFTASSVPGIQLSGVRFNGFGYETAVASYAARLRIEDRRLADPADTGPLPVRPRRHRIGRDSHAGPRREAGVRVACSCAPSTRSSTP